MDQPRSRHVPNTMTDISVQLNGLRWHGPISVVGAPIRSDGYGVVAPRPTLRAGALWGRGTLTRPAVLLPRAASSPTATART